MTQLTKFKLLSFDVYGTLIDWERGALKAFEPTLTRCGKTFQDPGLDQRHILEVLHTIESRVEKENPTLRYAQVLSKVHPALCKELGLENPTEAESEAFGRSVGTWPAFPDTVDALKRLSKTYKLVVLSNVDNSSFEAGNANALEGFKFDAVYTAEDIGSYKPDKKNFEYLIRNVKDQFGIEKDEILQTAQSQYHDHHPAKDIGIKSSWIYRPGAVMGNRDDPVFNWKFDTLGDMASQVEEELAALKISKN